MKGSFEQGKVRLTTHRQYSVVSTRDGEPHSSPSRGLSGRFKRLSTQLQCQVARLQCLPARLQCQPVEFMRLPARLQCQPPKCKSLPAGLQCQPGRIQVLTRTVTVPTCRIQVPTRTVTVKGRKSRLSVCRLHTEGLSLMGPQGLR